jgi:O-succinylbenzoic acid--CoA ligase
MKGWTLRASALERARAEAAMAACQRWPEGPGLVIGSGGSSGGRKWCLQSWRNLNQSAHSCGLWLEGIGIDPSRVQVVNPLPSDHMGGLMPQVRAQRWEAPLLAITPAELKDLEALLQRNTEIGAGGREPLISLVPTQLQRLLQQPAGIRWLQQFRLIWVGGAAMSPDLAQQARAHRLALSPCYGATETAAMVCAMDPSSFLAGADGCGQPLSDVQLRLEPNTNAIEVKTKRLSAGWLDGSTLQPFADAEGWWRSGDGGQLSSNGLQVLGRLDGALNSGGATVFPEQIEAALAGVLGVEALLVVGVPDPQWGQKLVGLVRPSKQSAPPTLLAELERAADRLPPAERPKQWVIRNDLTTNHQDKWERSRWAQKFGETAEA